MRWQDAPGKGIHSGRMGEGDAKPPKVRLKFIDLARSIAILLMLEGHFINLTLKNPAQYSGHPVFESWNFIRSLTAPLFFTAAGMIFVYLLQGEKGPVFHKRVRVRKGLRRAAELLFWGYALQLTAGNFPEYLHGRFESWVFTFHVLQCIGVGLIALLLIAGLREATGKFPLQFWYAAAMAASVGAYIWLGKFPADSRLPHSWPEIFQNSVKGPGSAFPMARWLGFTFLGGAMGAYLHSLKDRPVTQKSCLWFFAVAAALKLIWVASVFLPLETETAVRIQWFTVSGLRIAIFLGFLRWIEIRHGIGVEWLLRVGRETFAIYIVHAIVLYGAIFGIGLDDWLEGRLNPWQASAGAVLFIAAFTVHAQLLSAWKTRKAIHGGGGAKST